MEQQRLSGALQENILTVLCFDDDACKMVRGAVTTNMFESSVYREVAGIAIDFIDQFGKAVKEHLPDHMEGILKGDDQRKAKTYQSLLDNLFTAKDSVNSEYVLSQLHIFVRQQNLKSALLKAVEAIENNDVALAEVELQKGLKSQAVAFEGGTNLSSAEDVADILEHSEEEGFDIGIPEFDRRGVIPRRKEVFTFMAPRGRGKSWFITHCSKMGLLQGWSGVIVTLEMSERRYASRMLQSFFSISRREASVRMPRLVKDRDGSLLDVIHEQITRLTLKDDDIKEKLKSRAKREFRRRPNFRIKEFPTKSLTLSGLEAYLDGLERYGKFTPDFICIDYPDLMALNVSNLRLELGDLIAGIRGLCVKRNMAGIIVTQGNRESETAQLVTGDMAAEDISKLAVSDTFVTYSQTPMEKALGLARLFAAKARNEDSGFQALITQAYAVGQFCLDSMAIGENYWSAIGAGKESKDEEERPARRRQRQ